jgi:curved DNA-binding protein
LVKFKDYYQTLGVDRKATDKDIKAAYRKLARQHHPDANKGNKASEEKFKEITEAYEVLKDPEKRRRYDMLGSNYKAGEQFRPPPDFGGFSFDFGNLHDLGGKGSPFSDFFEMMFGQTFGPGAGQRPGGGPGARPQGPPGGPGVSRRKLDQEAEIELSIEELAKGTTRTLQITGPGQSKTIEVKIPAGVRAGSKVRVTGEGAKQPGGAGTPGDLYLKVKVKPHPLFVIDGDNLICDVNLSPAQAVIGGEASVNTLDGAVKIRIPPGTQAGRMLRLRGRGLPKLKSQENGDLLVRAKIVIPANVTDAEKALYEQLVELELQKG